MGGPAPAITFANEDQKQAFISLVRDAMYCSKICSYAQGMAMIKDMSQTKSWDLPLAEIPAIWRGGCIIRSIFLDRITEAYKENPDLDNLLGYPAFAKELQEKQASWRKVIAVAVMSGITVPALSGSLAYFDAMRRSRLPANLTQAQRDYFGAHQFQRVDDPEGTWVHTHWTDKHIVDTTAMGAEQY